MRGEEIAAIRERYREAQVKVAEAKVVSADNRHTARKGVEQAFYEIEQALKRLTFP